MYRTIRTILRYDTIHTIRTLYRTIHEHLRYADMIRNFLHMIRYISCDTDNYAHNISSHSTNLSSLFSFSASLNLSSFCTLWLSLSFGLGRWCLGRIMGIFGDRRSSSSYSDDEAFGGVFIRIRFYSDNGSGITLRTRALEVFLLVAIASKIKV